MLSLIAARSSRPRPAIECIVEVPSYHLRISSAELAPFSTTESFLDNSFDTVRVLHQLSFVPQRRAHESRDFDLARSPGREISRDRYEIESVIKLVIGGDSVLWGARALSTAKKTVLNAFRRSNLVRIRARRLHRAPPECRSKYRTVCQPVRDLARPRSARSWQGASGLTQTSSLLWPARARAGSSSCWAGRAMGGCTVCTMSGTLDRLLRTMQSRPISR